MKKKNIKIPFILRAINWLFPRLERLVPWLAKRWFVSIFFTPIRFKAPHGEVEAAAKANKFQLDYNRHTIQVYEWGEGKPVLFIHGWMGRGTQFRKFIPVFNKAGYKVVSFDALAHGRSEGSSTHILHFRDIINKLAIQYDFHMVIGHSIGGVAAMHALIAHTFTDKLIMIGSPTIGDRIITDFQKKFNASDASGDYLQAYIQKKLGKPFEEFSARHIVKDLKGVRLLLIHDQDDKEVLIDNAKTLAERYEPSDLITTYGLGHTRILKDEFVVEACLSFAHEQAVEVQYG